MKLCICSIITLFFSGQTNETNLGVLEMKLASLIAQLGKNPPAMQETRVRFLGSEDLLEKG